MKQCVLGWMSFGSQVLSVLVEGGLDSDCERLVLNVIDHHGTARACAVQAESRCYGH